MSGSEDPQRLSTSHANEGPTAETETEAIADPSTVLSKPSDLDHEELRVNGQSKSLDPTTRPTPSPAVLQPSPIRSKPLRLASSDELDAAPPLDVLPTVKTGTHDQGSDDHRASFAPAKHPYVSPAAACEPSLTTLEAPATKSLSSDTTSQISLHPTSPRAQTSKVTAPHALLSLDAVWREPLILPAFRDRRSSTVTRERPFERPNARTATAEDRDDVVSRGNTVAGPHSHLDPHISPGAGLSTTGPIAQGTEREARTLQNSTKANTAQDRTDARLSPKSASLGPPPARQDHRPIPQTPSTPKSSRAALPKDAGAEPAPLAPFSLWEYLREEVLATDVDSTQEMRWDRVSNFMAVPWQCEKVCRGVL